MDAYDVYICLCKRKDELGLFFDILPKLCKWCREDLLLPVSHHRYFKCSYYVHEMIQLHMVILQFRSSVLLMSGTSLF